MTDCSGSLAVTYVIILPAKGDLPAVWLVTELQEELAGRIRGCFLVQLDARSRVTFKASSGY